MGDSDSKIRKTGTAPRRTLKRRLFQLWFRITRPLTMGARAIVTDEKERVLLVRHTYLPGWTFPGGGVERHETAEECIRHELEEEAGIILTARPELFALYSNRAVFPGDHVALYLVAPGTYERHAWAPNREIAEARFFAPDALPRDITPGAARRLREVREGARPDPEW